VFAPDFFQEIGNPAIAEIRRVLRPGGIAALCHRAWDRLDVEPFSLELAEAFNDYRALLDQSGNAADEGTPWIDWLHDAGFGILDTGVSFEDVDNPEFLADAFAVQLELAGNSRAATTLLHWADEPDCRMTQMWRHVVAIRGEA
jgi:SAM-dependent methyltransferase